MLNTAAAVMVLAGLASVGPSTPSEEPQPRGEVVVPKEDAPSTAKPERKEPEPAKKREFFIYATPADAEERMQEGDIVVVLFTADWCGPCQRLKADLFSDEMKAWWAADSVVAFVDTDEHPEIKQAWGVSTIPAMYLYKPGKTKHTRVGYSNKESHIKWVRRVYQELNK